MTLIIYLTFLLYIQQLNGKPRDNYTSYNYNSDISAAVQLSSNIDIPCPNERVIIHCVISTSVMVWSVTPPSQGAQARTFYRSNQDSFVLTWSSLSTTIRLSVETVGSASFTTMAEFIATPELDGTVFVCSGTTAAKEKVLHLAS